MINVFLLGINASKIFFLPFPLFSHFEWCDLSRIRDRQFLSFGVQGMRLSWPMVSVIDVLYYLCFIVDKDFLCILASNIFKFEVVPSTMMWLYVGSCQLTILRICLEILTVRISVMNFGNFSTIRYCLSLLSNIFLELQWGRSCTVFFCSAPPILHFFSPFLYSSLFCVTCCPQVSSVLVVLFLEFPAEILPLKLPFKSHVLDYILHSDFSFFFTNHYFPSHTIMSESIPTLQISVLKTWSQDSRVWLYL